MAEGKYPDAPVLMIDDEEPILVAAEVALELSGISNVVTCQTSQDVEALIDKTNFSVVTLDLIMPRLSGVQLLPVIRDRLPEASIIVVTGNTDLETAVELMKQGAYDYLVKPVDKTRLVTAVQKGIESWEMRVENRALRGRLLAGRRSESDAFERIVTCSEAMDGIFSYIEAIAATSLPVLISGETGVGKELLAQSVHLASGRSGEFIPVNTAGLDDQLFSDTLFGHRRGAFTDATTDRKGMLSRAAGGTLFLDEIGDLSPESQTKLLRLIQEREYYQLGSDVPESTDARFVFATNRNLDQMVADGRFRQDLYYRLRSHRVVVPPLRERPDDIPLLVDLFLEQAAEETGKPRPTPPGEIYDHLRLYDYPGNVRELRGLVYDAVVRHSGGVMSLQHFDESVIGAVSEVESRGGPRRGESDGLAEGEDPLFSALPRLPHLKETTDRLVAEALHRTGGNQTLAAKLLGITRTALNKRLIRGDRSE